MTAGKAALRARLRAQREAVTAEAAALASEELAGQMVMLPEYRAASTVALFCAFRGELDPLAIVARPESEGKRFCLPQSHRAEKRLSFHAISTPPGSTSESVQAALAPGAYGILEPSGPEVPLADLDFVVVPALGFDRAGHRLGWGAGYYDRVLAGLPGSTVTAVIGFDFQLLDELPAEPHDHPVRRIVTPSGARSAI